MWTPLPEAGEVPPPPQSPSRKNTPSMNLNAQPYAPTFLSVLKSYRATLRLDGIPGTQKNSSCGRLSTCPTDTFESSILSSSILDDDAIETSWIGDDDDFVTAALQSQQQSPMIQPRRLVKMRDCSPTAEVQPTHGPGVGQPAGAKAGVSRQRRRAGRGSQRWKTVEGKPDQAFVAAKFASERSRQGKACGNDELLSGGRFQALVDPKIKRHL